MAPKFVAWIFEESQKAHMNKQYHMIRTSEDKVKILGPQKARIPINAC